MFYSINARSQSTYPWGYTLPSTCSIGQFYLVLSNTGSAISSIKTCSQTNTWTDLSGGSSIPTGSIIFIDSGSCPAGFAEVAALANKFIRVGTIGQIGGSDNITPTGTIAINAHAHELPYQISSTTTIRQIAVATFGTGTNRAATAVSAAGSANTTSAAVALSQSVIATGTFTGIQFDNRPAFINLIGCKKS